MGSFTEAVLAFSLKSDTPEQVIAAFRPPDLEEDYDEGEELLYGLETGEIEDVGQLSLKDRAYIWQQLFAGMESEYFPGAPSTSIRDQGSGWTVTARFHWKAPASFVCQAIGPLGAFIEGDNDDPPSLVGYVKYEYDDHPLLVWHRGETRLEFEDLRLDPSD